MRAIPTATASVDAPYRDPPKLRALRHVVRSRLSEHPTIYLPLARLRYPGPSPEVIGPETELVIDGYTRSACTFAVYAFQMAQTRPVRLAHHLHAPAQLIEAARRGVPALVVVREPAGAILSQVIRERHVSLAGALVSYERFYSRLIPYGRSLVAGRFEEITTDPASAIRKLNERFGTRYVEFEATRANIERCFDLMQDRPTRHRELRALLLGFESGLVTLDRLLAARSEVERLSGEPVAGRDTWVPSEDRGREKERLRARWNAPELAERRECATRTFHAFLDATRVEP